MELTKKTTKKTTELQLGDYQRCQFWTDCIPEKYDSPEFVLENISLASFFYSMRYIYHMYGDMESGKGIAAKGRHAFSSSVLEMSKPQ